MKARFTEALISDQMLNPSMPLYCAFSKEQSASCDELGVGDYEANGIIYKRDLYWNKTATIPSQASVLLLSSKLDPQTPHKYVEFLFDVLDGDQKELITFDYGSHDAVVGTPMVAEDPGSATCGMKVLATYVRNDGDLDLIDKSCVGKMSPFSLIVPDSYLTSFLATNDAYDGVWYNVSLDSSS